jgi:linoleate 8R-lipoxygenase / 9,12-octadecadienoate 8-hydroperoxide 8R-isomerase
MEGSRIRSTVGLTREATRSVEIEDKGTKITLKTGQRVLCNLVSTFVLPHASQA